MNTAFIGQERWKTFFRTVIESDKLSHAYLLAGPRHVGKRTFAEMLARNILCRGKGAACEKCSVCLAYRKSLDNQWPSHPDLVVLSQKTKDNTTPIEEVRIFVAELSKKPLVSSHRVSIIPDSNKLTIPSLNLLLKTLEEPPSKIVLIIIAESPGALPATVRSRLQFCRFSILSRLELAHALQKRGVQHGHAEELAALSDGRPGLAINWLEQSRELINYKKRAMSFMKLCQGNNASRFAFTETIAKEDQLSRQELLEVMSGWKLVLRDLLLVAISEPALVTHRNLLSDFEKIATRGTVKKWLKAMKELELSTKRVARYSNRRLALNNFFLNLAN